MGYPPTGSLNPRPTQQNHIVRHYGSKTTLWSKIGALWASITHLDRAGTFWNSKPPIQYQSVHPNEVQCIPTAQRTVNLPAFKVLYLKKGEILIQCFHFILLANTYISAPEKPFYYIKYLICLDFVFILRASYIFCMSVLFCMNLKLICPRVI